LIQLERFDFKQLRTGLEAPALVERGDRAPRLLRGREDADDTAIPRSQVERALAQ
jgi:hypothetical protein